MPTRDHPPVINSDWVLFATIIIKSTKQSRNMQLKSLSIPKTALEFVKVTHVLTFHGMVFCLSYICTL